MTAVAFSIQQAVRAIASQCDGAREQDGVGFNGRDAHFGKSLAAIPHDDWSIRMLQTAHAMLRTYRTQLAGMGIEYDALLAPEPEFRARLAAREARRAPRPEVALGPRRIFRDEQRNRWLLEFPYDRAVIDGLKALGVGAFLANRPSEPTRYLWPVYEDKLLSVIPLLTGFEGAEDVAAGAVAREALKESNRKASGALVAQADVSITSVSGKRSRAYQDAGVEYVLRAKRVLNGDQMGLGKFHPVDTDVLTPTGWRKIGKIRPGDEVIGSAGRPVRVTGIFPQGVKPSFRVVFSDGSSVEAGAEHLWSVEHRSGSGARRKWVRITLTTEQLRTRPFFGKLDLSKHALYLPIMSAPAQFNGTPLPIGGYTLGALIANGSLAHGTPQLSYASWDWDAIKVCLESEGTKVGAAQQYENVIRASLVGICETVRHLGLNVLSARKRIPEAYMTAEVRSRIALLHGLMDADGSISTEGNRVTYHTTGDALADDVRELVEGLGGIASVRSYDRSHENKPTDYQVRIRLPASIPPFLSPRKAARHKPGTHSTPRRTLVSVEYVRDVESVCIAVNAEDRLYVTERCILTHNTIQGIAVLVHTRAFPALVVPPASLKLNWLKELAEWAPDLSAEIIKAKKDVPSGKADVYIANYDILKSETVYMVKGLDRPITKAELEELNEERAKRGSGILEPRGIEILTSVAKRLKALGLKSIIFDEFHFCKHKKSQRSKAAKLLAKDVEYRLGLTGTPVEIRPIELASQLDILGRLDSDFGGYMRFAKTYCQAHETPFGLDVSGDSNLDILHRRLRECCYVRRLKEEVLSELPPKVCARIPIKLSNRAEYDSAEENYLEWVLENEGREKALRASRAEEITRIGGLQQIAARGKVDGIKEWVEGFLEAGEKLVLFAHHIAVQHALLAGFPGAVAIQGGAAKEAVEEAKARFFGAADLIVCSIKAGGLGHTLHADGRCSNVAMSEFPWSPAQQEQCEDRVHRIGQTSESVNVWELYAPGTIDDDTLAMLDERRKVVDAVTDGGERERAKVDSVEGALVERMKLKAREMRARKKA